MSAPLQGTQSAALAIDRVKYSHDAMIDLIITNPAIKQGDLAKAFGYTQAWVSRVMNSDAFLARLAARKADIIDPSITATFDEKLRALADQSLTIVMDKLSATQNPDTAMKALELSTRALGYGAKQQNVAVQQNFVVALPAKIADPGAWAAQARLAGAEAGHKSVVSVVEVGDAVEVRR